MILPPLFINVHVSEHGESGYWIPIPLLLLWPLLLIVVGFLFVLAVLADAVLTASGARYHHYTHLVLGTWELLAETRGTRAHIDNGHTLVDFDVY